jgi:effector-binding domain-containing protein
MNKFYGTLLAFSFLLVACSPKGELKFPELENPRIIDKPDSKALVVRFDGDPAIVIKKAYGAVYGCYYGLKGVPKGKNQPAPVARYEDFWSHLEAGDDIKSVAWKGYVAVPVPDSVTEIPAKWGKGDYPVTLETLEYGLVAEIVHYGPYETETAAIGRLMAHIGAEGYTITGLHEEEYIRGPGMPFVKPEQYVTVIRYQVTR